MFTNDDLNKAIEKDIFTQESVKKFQAMLAEVHALPQADEENFRLVGGFNDIFVVIASLLVFVSAAWVMGDGAGASIVISLIAWGLAEVFVRQRRMALPAIVLLIAFLGGLFGFGMAVSHKTVFVAGLLATIGAFVHWRRFHVPVTVAGGAATVSSMLIGLLMQLFPILKDHWEILTFFSGILVFVLAMWWDTQDRKRITSHSDIAFWLHLLAAPMIVHSVFMMLNVFEGELSLLSIAFILLLYAVLSIVSLIIDRRAFMVSSLIYVLYAISALFSAGNAWGDGLPIGGLLIGGMLLVLTVYWAKVRAAVLGWIPEWIRIHVPASEPT